MQKIMKTKPIIWEFWAWYFSDLSWKYSDDLSMFWALHFLKT